MGRSLHAARTRRAVISIAVALLASATTLSPATASHDLFRRLSAGAVNGNGAFSAGFTGASSDGTRVFFATSEPLVAADTDVVQDVYERSGGTTTVVSPGNGSFLATFKGTSDDGSAVFYETSEKVIANDEDSANDVYGAYRAP